MTARNINALYQTWASNPTPHHLNALLEAVRRIVYLRYRKQYSDADDISQLVMIKAWRSLPGYPGLDPLKPYDSSRAKFNAFVSCVARTTVIDAHKYNRLVPTSDEDLEALAMS